MRHGHGSGRRWRNKNRKIENVREREAWLDEIATTDKPPAGQRRGRPHMPRGGKDVRPGELLP